MVMSEGMNYAKIIASDSNDPSTKVGAMITNGNLIVSTGHNRFPKGVAETQERLNDRPTKYAMVLHAEANAILNAGRGACFGATMYVTLPPCCECAKLIIEAGIKRIITHAPTDYQLERWGESFEYAKIMFKEAGVEVIYE
jgi:dCMP deaminase